MNTLPEPTLIKNVRVFDGITFLAAPHDVSIADGRISALSPSGSAPLSEHGTILDGTGHTLTPGLIDSHVHLMTSSGTALSQLSEPFSLQFFEAAAAMKATLQAGVTTVRDAGGADLGVKVAQERGIAVGPAIKLSISILSQTGGHGDGWLRDGVHQPMVGEHPGRPSGVGDGADGMRATTRRMFRAGADQIKICTTGGVLSPYDDPRHSQLTLPEISAIVEEAQMRGSYVMAHAQGTPGIISAIEAGVRSIEHGIYLDRRAADMMAAAGMFLVPTLQAPLQVIRNADAGMQLPPQTVEKARRVVDDHRAAVAIAREAGVTIVMGTDAGVGPHGHNLEELGLLADVGLTTTEVLASATSKAAELMMLDDIGRIEVGAKADLVLCATDLEASGVEQLQPNIVGVWQGGRRVDLG